MMRTVCFDSIIEIFRPIKVRIKTIPIIKVTEISGRKARYEETGWNKYLIITAKRVAITKIIIAVKSRFFFFISSIMEGLSFRLLLAILKLYLRIKKMSNKLLARLLPKKT